MQHYNADQYKAKALFRLGHIVATPGALGVLYEHSINVAELLGRHATGDWGDLDEHDKQLNDDALKEGSRILSAYGKDQDKKLWIITEADRSHTTILRPSEY